MIVRAIISTAIPEKTALWFATILAVDKGYTSTIQRDGASRIVVASDGQAVRFNPLP